MGLQSSREFCLPRGFIGFSTFLFGLRRAKLRREVFFVGNSVPILFLFCSDPILFVSKIRPGNSHIRGWPPLGYNPNPKGGCFSVEFLAGGLAAGNPLGGLSCPLRE